MKGKKLVTIILSLQVLVLSSCGLVDKAVEKVVDDGSVKMEQDIKTWEKTEMEKKLSNKYDKGFRIVQMVENKDQTNGIEILVHEVDKNEPIFKAVYDTDKRLVSDTYAEELLYLQLENKFKEAAKAAKMDVIISAGLKNTPTNTITDGVNLSKYIKNSKPYGFSFTIVLKEQKGYKEKLEELHRKIYDELGKIRIETNVYIVKNSEFKKINTNLSTYAGEFTEDDITKEGKIKIQSKFQIKQGKEYEVIEESDNEQVKEK